MFLSVQTTWDCFNFGQVHLIPLTDSGCMKDGEKSIGLKQNGTEFRIERGPSTNRIRVPLKPTSNTEARAGCVMQWQNSYLACMYKEGLGLDAQSQK